MRDRNEALQLKDKDLASLRKKEQNFRVTVESLQNKLDIESTRNRDLDEQVKMTARMKSKNFIFIMIDQTITKTSEC